jgi:hypothetical protein
MGSKGPYRPQRGARSSPLGFASTTSKSPGVDTDGALDNAERHLEM